MPVHTVPILVIHAADLRGLSPFPCWFQYPLPEHPSLTLLYILSSSPPGDDLVDYEDDITAGGGSGSFNILRCLVHLYGQDAPLQLAQRVGQLEAQREELLRALPPAQQEHVRRRQVDAAEEGEGALRWQVPSLVLDEGVFRQQYA